jgi:cyclic pyranopterin phosphate synthase
MLAAPPAAASGLNISLDSLQPERFEQLTRRRGHFKVMESIHKAVQLGFDPVKVGGS